MIISRRFNLFPITSVLGVFSLTSLVGADQVVIQSSEVQVAYKVNRESEPLSQVTLWYSVDGGASWTEYGSDPDRQSPAGFRAPGDGEYGFFLVLENETGPSSQAPVAGTPPQLTVLVDQTQPVVQLHALRASVLFGKPVVQVRWTAIDSLLSPRPIELEYRTPADPSWHPVTTGPIPNTGRFDWTPPEQLRGTVALRVLVRDRGNHVSESEALTIELGSDPGLTQTPFASRAESPREMSTAASRDSVGRGGPGPAVSGSPRARERAAQLISEGKARRDASDARAAIARFRDAVRLDPGRADAFAEMARLFYGLGEWDRALSAYDIVLQHNPSEREALLGSAMVHTKRKDYSAAGEKLRTILRHDPGDIEVWMNLGDVAIYGGDEVLARDCYMRASQTESGATVVAEEARKRLSLMDDVSRRYVDR